MKVLRTTCMAALSMLMATLSLAANQDSVEVQNAREGVVKARGAKVFYSKTWDLSDLPAYKPEQQVKGTIRMWGANYLTDSPLAEWWAAAFKKFQPDADFDFHMKTTLHAIPSLIMGVADIGMMGRQILWQEELSYQREFGRLPTGIVGLTGSYNVSGWNPPVGVYLNKDNPISKLSLEQLDGIFGAQRTGAWRDLVWDTSLARGPEKNIRTWGQLGLKGEWADKPIHVHGYNLQFNFAQEIESRAFGGVSKKWTETLQEYDNQAMPDGSLKAAGQIMMEKVAKDKYAIAYMAGGQSWLTPDVKAAALSVKNGGPYYELNLDNVRSRTYPMYADVFFWFNKEPGKPLDPKVREFLRFILSRDGQALVMKDGKYLPLTAKVIAQERSKLD
jgi:phosphate transport system substrate-binding protein